MRIVTKFAIIGTMNRIRVSKRVEKKLAKGLVLLEASDLENINLKDQEVEVHSQDGNFLGTAYLSQQNKGLGWFVSTDKVTFNQAFFETLFRQAKEKRSAYYQDELTTAFRLFNQEGDGFGGLTVDLYGDYAVFSWYNSYVYQIRQIISEAFRKVFPEVWTMNLPMFMVKKHLTFSLFWKMVSSIKFL